MGTAAFVHRAPPDFIFGGWNAFVFLLGSGTYEKSLGKVESTKYDNDDGEFFVDVGDFTDIFPILCFAKTRKTQFKL